jgi:acyl-coenzyme A synthetase/AMP-(fatty) acid ligase
LQQLRRHGDIIKRTAGGYFIVQGRADDTMNLGGIKVFHSLELLLFQLLSGLFSKFLNLDFFPDHLQTSSVEIEHACNNVDQSIVESIAISAAPEDGGPELLVMFAVLKEGYSSKPEDLQKKFTRAIQTNLNPLFKVCHFTSTCQYAYILEVFL